MVVQAATPKPSEAADMSIPVHMPRLIDIYIYIYIYVCVCVCVCVKEHKENITRRTVCVYVCVYVCVHPAALHSLLRRLHHQVAQQPHTAGGRQAGQQSLGERRRVYGCVC